MLLLQEVQLVPLPASLERLAHSAVPLRYRFTARPLCSSSVLLPPLDAVLELGNTRPRLEPLCTYLSAYLGGRAAGLPGGEQEDNRGARPLLLIPSVHQGPLVHALDSLPGHMAVLQSALDRAADADAPLQHGLAPLEVYRAMFGLALFLRQLEASAWHVSSQHRHRGEGEGAHQAHVDAALPFVEGVEAFVAAAAGGRVPELGPAPGLYAGFHSFSPHPVLPLRARNAAHFDADGSVADVTFSRDLSMANVLKAVLSHLCVQHQDVLQGQAGNVHVLGFASGNGVLARVQADACDHIVQQLLALPTLFCVDKLGAAMRREGVRHPALVAQLTPWLAAARGDEIAAAAAKLAGRSKGRALQEAADLGGGSPGVGVGGLPALAGLQRQAGGHRGHGRRAAATLASAVAMHAAAAQRGPPRSEGGHGGPAVPHNHGGAGEGKGGWGYLET